MIVLLATLLGGVGAVARLMLDGEVKARLGDRFPWGTLLVNALGSLALGVLTGLVVHRGASGDLRVVLGTGFCGGFTTFSTATVETVRLAQRGEVVAALGNVLGTVALTLGAAALGYASTF
ncbi:fluoride efflux transporter FluC [Jatrophihabitans fulvus]